MTQQLIAIIVNGQDEAAAASGVFVYVIEVGRELITRGAETLIALLGMTRYNAIIIFISE